MGRKDLKTEWNLKLLYKSDSDPQIEKDLRTGEKVCLDFEKKHKGKSFASSTKTLLLGLKDYEKLESLDIYKPWWYFALKSKLDSGNSKAGALATKYNQRITESVNKIRFFTLEIAKIPAKQQKIFLTDKKLESFRYFLKKIFTQAQYNLSEGEEQVISLLSQPGYSMWKDTQRRQLTEQMISHGGEDMPITEAIMKIPDLPKKSRRELSMKVNTILKSISHVAEGELNAICNFKKILDNRRGYKKPYSSTIISYENKEESIEQFVKLATKHLKISQRFFTLHARLLGEKKITVADRSAKIGKLKTRFDFKTSVSVLRDLLVRVDQEYLDIFDRYLRNGQVDVYPRKDKEGGAFCWGMGVQPTYVLLNHVNDVQSLETIAHEMGHAFHTESSKKQTPLYRDYTTATAEVASTFFEQLLSDEIEKHLSPKEKIIHLHNKLIEDIATIFRQIACFNFELELHERIRKEGQVPKEEIAKLMAKHLQSYLGPSVEVTLEDGYFFVYWSHIRNFFYVYTYAYGQLISKALFARWKEDPNYMTKIKQFLSAGGSMSPEDIFKKIGINTSSPAFFETGLKSIEKDIIKLEKLTRSNG